MLFNIAVTVLIFVLVIFTIGKLIFGWYLFSSPKKNIWMAAKDGDVDRLKDLLASEKHGIDERNEDDLSLLHIASQNGHLEIASTLLEYGANPNIKDFMGKTPLHSNALGYSTFTYDDFKDREFTLTKTADLLINKGAEVDAIDKEGSTPLLIAGMNVHMGLVELLLSKGANINIKNNKGTRLIDYMPVAGSLFRKYGFKYNSIHEACFSMDFETVKEYVESGADINAKDNEGSTLLDQLSGSEIDRDLECAVYLRKHGAKTAEELDLKPSETTTQLTEHPNKKIIKIKIWYTAKLIAGFTFLSFAIWLSYWLLFEYQARNIYAIIAIALFLVFPSLICVLKTPTELRLLMAVWRSDDPASMDKAVGDLREQDML